MTIRETQRSRVIEEIVSDSLRKGIFPSVHLIEDQLAEYFKKPVSGQPRFVYQEIEKSTGSSSKWYNESFENIHEDLQVGFAEMRELNNDIMSLYQYYESNRIKIERSLKRLELKADVLVDRTLKQKTKDVIGDNFHDFLMVDFKGDPERNIPRTNTFVDLRYGEIQLDTIKHHVYKHDISNVRTKLRSLVKDTKMIHLSPISNAFQDYVSHAWRSVVSSPTPIQPKVELYIELEKMVGATHLSIDTQVGKPVTVTAYLSKDGKKYQQLETRKVTHTFQWIFERQDVQFVRLEFHKAEEDVINGSTYEYIFGAKQIELKEQQFKNDAYFVSRPFEIVGKNAFNRIKLEKEDYIPSSTNIRYYVGLDYDTNLIEWQEIREDRPIETGMIQSNYMEINSFIDGYADLIYNQFGQGFHRLVELPHRPLPGSTKLMLGRNMWMKETIPSTIESGENIYQTSMRDWIRTGTSNKEYISIDAVNKRYRNVLKEKTFQRFTTYLYIHKKQVIETEIQAQSKTSHGVYINNQEVRSINQEKDANSNDLLYQYQLQLKEGWNKVQIITYTSDVDQQIMLDFYLKELSDQIFAYHRALTQVSLYDLLHNVSHRIHEHFAIDDDNNIIVNYDPKFLDISGNGIDYTLEYDYSSSDEMNHQIRMMAILSKKDRSVLTSPRLKQYKLIIE